MGVIDLLFLLIIIPYCVWMLAKERNESALKWSLAAIGAWIGAELIIGTIVGLLKNPIARLGFAPRGNIANIFSILFYLLVFTAAAASATLVIRQLRKKPITQS